MKKIIAGLVLAVTVLPALAQYHHHHRHHPHAVFKPGIGWVIPTLIGGVITYEIIRQQQPVVVQQQVMCTDWKEIQTPDGKVYKERTCTQPQQ